jgi:heme exporter protein CcmD
MDTIKNFIDMSGYGSYVWPSYLVTAGVMIVMLVASQRLLKANIAKVEALENLTKEDLE